MAKRISNAASQLVNVFVYGTLKRGQPNFYWMTDAKPGASAKLVATGRMPQEYPLVIATRYNVPFLLDRPGTGKVVQGEIFAVDDDKMEQLDELEEFPEFYTRKELDIEIIEEFETVDNIDRNGNRIKCWVYMLESFPEFLLSKPMLESYSSTVEQPYTERSQRFIGLTAKDDFEFELYYSKLIPSHP